MLNVALAIMGKSRRSYNVEPAKLNYLSLLADGRAARWEGAPGMRCVER